MARWQPALLDQAVAGGRILIHSHQHFLSVDGHWLLPAESLDDFGITYFRRQGLGHFDGEPVLLCELPNLRDIGCGRWQSLRELLRSDIEVDVLSMLRYASQIGTWYAQHRYCGSCGRPLQPHPRERAMCCLNCGLQHYPRLSPCMIVLVTRGDEILLAHGTRHPAGLYSTLAGFVEPGETVEQCVEREVLEEVGLRVSDIRYVGSQNWPFPHALMLGFEARYAGGDICPQLDEIADARWFRIDALPELPGPFSIARYLIERYVARRLGQPEPPFPA